MRRRAWWRAGLGAVACAAHGLAGRSWYMPVLCGAPPAVRPGPLAVVVAAYYLLPLDSAFTAATVLALLAWQVRTIMRSARPGLRALTTLATALPLFLLLIASACYLLERNTPESFARPPSGDLVPGFPERGNSAGPQAPSRVRSSEAPPRAVGPCTASTRHGGRARSGRHRLSSEPIDLLVRAQSMPGRGRCHGVVQESSSKPMASSRESNTSPVVRRCSSNSASAIASSLRWTARSARRSAFLRRANSSRVTDTMVSPTRSCQLSGKPAAWTTMKAPTSSRQNEKNRGELVRFDARSARRSNGPRPLLPRSEGCCRVILREYRKRTWTASCQPAMCARPPARVIRSGAPPRAHRPAGRGPVPLVAEGRGLLHRPGRAASSRRRPGRGVRPGEPCGDPRVRARQGVRDR